MAIEIQFTRAGIHLPQLGLWLDARKGQREQLAFVSHAHADHIAAHREVVLTDATALFMRSRLPGKRQERLPKFGERTELRYGNEAFYLTLLPAGHILGSAMAFIEWRGHSLLYTGDFKLRESLAAERCEPRRADTLIMETTFGLPHYRFPEEKSVRADMVRFCRETLADGETPVLFGYSLGKSQEILQALASEGLAVMLHSQVRKMTKLYKRLGQPFLDYDGFDAAQARGKVVVCPPQTLTKSQLQNLGKIRTAIVTGWAMDSSCRYRSGTDAAFPLSDHADFDGLVELVKQVQPKKIFTIHGFAREFAGTLRGLGFDALAPGWHEQLALFQER